MGGSELESDIPENRALKRSNVLIITSLRLCVLFRDTEIRNLADTLFIYEDIGRFDILKERKQAK